MVLCVRGERVVCYKGVPKEPRQDLVVVYGDLHYEGEIFRRVRGHSQSAADDETVTLMAHVGTDFLFGGHRVGFVLLVPPHVEASLLQGCHFAYSRGPQHPETDRFDHIRRI